MVTKDLDSLIWMKQSYQTYSRKYLFNPFYAEKTSPHYIFEEWNFSFRYVRLCDLDIPREKWLEYYVESGLGQHCLPITILRVSR